MRVVTLLTVVCILSAQGAAAQNSPVSTAAARPPMPEAVSGAATTTQTPVLNEAAALRRYIESLENLRPNYSELTPDLANTVRQQLPTILVQIRNWGALKSINFASEPGSNGAYTFEATFEHSKVEWYIAPLTADGKVETVSFKLVSQLDSDVISHNLYDEGISIGATKAQDVDSVIEAIAKKIQATNAAVKDIGQRALQPRFVYTVAAFPSEASEYVQLGKRGLISLAAFSRYPEELPLKRVYTRIAGKDVELLPIASMRRTVPPGPTRQVFGEYREDSIYLVPVQFMVSGSPLLGDFAANRNGFPISNMTFATPDFIANDPERTSTTTPTPQMVKDFIARAFPDFGAVPSQPVNVEATTTAATQLRVSSNDLHMAGALQNDSNTNICRKTTDQHAIDTSNDNVVNVDSAFLASFTKCMSEKGWNLRLDTPAAQWVRQTDDTLGGQNLGGECKFAYSGKMRDTLVVPALTTKQASMVMGNGDIAQFDVHDFKLDTPDMRLQNGWVVLTFYPKEDFASGPDLITSIDPCTNKVTQAELHYDE